MDRVWPLLSRRGLLAALLSAPGLASAEQRLARARSRLGRLEVVERDGVILLLEDGQIHSAFDPRAPDRLVFPYLELFAAVVAAAAGPRPGRALVIGLGGGAFSRWLLGRGYEVHGVDINRSAVRLARRYLALDPRIVVHIDDGRRFLDRAEPSWDLIVLDASSEDYIPPQLLSVECFAQVRRLLAPPGLVLMNSWTRAPRADDELATFGYVFEHCASLVRRGSAWENRVLVGSPRPLELTLPSAIERTPIAAGIGSLRHDRRRRTRSRPQSDSPSHSEDGALP